MAREEFFCCLLSKLAYFPKNTLIGIFQHRPYTQQNALLDGCTLPQCHESTKDAQCFTTQKNDKLYISFRGTESIRDCLTDANILRVPMDLPGIPDNQRPLVHWGFLRQFRSLEPALDKDIMSHILDHQTKHGFEGRPELVITGHSLGAAQCTLAGLQFKLRYPQTKVSCYTYGSPRVGNSQFVWLFEKHVDHYERIVNEEDPVTMIPFAWRFRHIPQYLYLNEAGTVLNGSRENPWWSFFVDLFHWAVSGKENPIGDHSCEDYLNKLERNCDSTPTGDAP